MTVHLDLPTVVAIVTVSAVTLMHAYLYGADWHRRRVDRQARADIDQTIAEFDPKAAR